MKQKVLALLAALMMFSSAAPLAVPLVTAQEIAISSPEDIMSSDTATSVFPTVEFEVVEAELPSEQIQIDEATIYSDEYFDLTEYYDGIVMNNEGVYDYLPKDNFRDVTTHSDSYLYYTNPETLEIVLPINLSTDLLDIFNVDSLMTGIWVDMFFKNKRVYNYLYTDDLFEAYELNIVFTPEMLADMKANYSRALDIVANVPETDPYYSFAVDRLEDIESEYENFEQRYNKAMLEDTSIEIEYSDEAVQNEESEESITVIEEALAPIPDHLKIRIPYVGIVSSYELPASWNYEPIDAFATPNLEMFFTDDHVVSPGLVYHELGHIVDFSMMLYEDASMETYLLPSLTDEWRDIFQAEWAEEGSYYNQEGESFAQAFGAYAIEYYQGTTMEEAGYDGYGLDGRPLSRAYFEQLFIDLEL